MEIGKSISVRLKLGRGAAQTGAEQSGAALTGAEQSSAALTGAALTGAEQSGAAQSGEAQSGEAARTGRKIAKGTIVRSEAGRDRGKLFLALAEEGEYLLLADGKGRKLESPKRKKRRHVSFVSARETRVSRKILGGEKLSNSELRRTLAAFREAADQEG